jgi:flavin-dependent dehydrogenase
VATGAEVLIVGAGPAGIATAIAASQKGLRATVVDARKPPIDKPCGEGLLPEGVAALQQLGIWLDSSVAFPIAGLRFSDETSSACGKITRGAAFGLRRSVLHELLVRRATELGVTFRWGTRVTELTSSSARLDGALFPFHWLVGADGQKSMIRKWSGLGPRRMRSARFGFRCHYAIPPWSDFVEVYWGEHCQIYVTPTGPDEICLAVLTTFSCGGAAVRRCAAQYGRDGLPDCAGISAQRGAWECSSGGRCVFFGGRNYRAGNEPRVSTGGAAG